MRRAKPLQRTVLSRSATLRRAAWQIVWALFYRPSPTPLHGWRRMLLRLFGARVERGAHPYPSSRVWAPWNLVMEAHSCLGRDVDCYSVAPIRLGPHAIVSQYSYLCAASHDIQDPMLALTSAPIVIEAHAWVAADCFIGPGVRIGRGAVVGARSTIVRDVDEWTVVAGAPPVVRGVRPRFEAPT